MSTQNDQADFGPLQAATFEELTEELAKRCTLLTMHYITKTPVMHSAGQKHTNGRRTKIDKDSDDNFVLGWLSQAAWDLGVDCDRVMTNRQSSIMREDDDADEPEANA